MKAFFSNYHISVNHCFVDDVLALGHEVIMPDGPWATSFFASNHDHAHKAGVYIVNESQFMADEPMAIVIPCNQMYDDFMRLYEARGKKDRLVYLTALSTTTETFPLDGTDFVITHDLIYHRQTKAKYKILYFNEPLVTVDRHARDIRAGWESKQINLFINNLYKGGFEVEIPIIEEFKKLWPNLKIYGYDNPDGWPQPPLTHELIINSMFTLSPKRRETWGQNVNESMLMGVPVIVFDSTLNSTFTEYLLTPDNAIMAKTAKEAIKKIQNMTFEEYETLCVQARTMSELYCATEPRRKQLGWLLNKVSGSL